MKRRILAFLILVLCTTTAFGAPTPERNIELSIDGHKVAFDAPPVLINGEVMVPMRPFFESLGTEVNWIEETSTAVAYKSNMFIKLQIDNKTAYKNGKAFKLKSPPVIRNNRTLVPAQFIAETFDMKSEWVNKNHLNFSSTADLPEYYRFGDYFYKKQALDAFGVSFSIPNYWDILNASQNIFGIKTSTTTYSIQFSQHDGNAFSDLGTFLSQYRQSLVDLYGDLISIKKSVSINYNNLNGYRFKSTLKLKDETQYHVYYLFFANGRGYLFNGYYTDTRASSELEDIFEKVVSTFQVESVSVNSKNEHYVEYPQYFALNFKLDQELHSNMEVRNSFDFSGSLAPKDLMQLYVKVSKGNESIYFNAPIQGNTFKTKIYTPFGLGKHDITVMTKKDANINSNNGILQFSVINLSSDKIRYIIPSEKISSDNAYIVSQANLLTYKASSDYGQAKSIYDWIMKEIAVEDLSSSKSERNVEQVYFDKVGTEEEVIHLYAAMLRAAGIPTRIVHGSISEVKTSHVWAEIYVNGKWSLSDPVYATRYGNIDIVNQTLYISYFRLNTDHYNTLFDTIVTANY